MKKFLGAVVIFGLVMAPVFAVQTGGAGALNPEVVKGAFTAEANASSQTLEVTSGITKLGTPTYTWPAALGPENSYLKDSGTGTLTWEVISGTSAAGETGQIQFNSSDNFAASENLSWDASGNNKLFVTGTVEATYFSGDGGQLSNVTPAGSAGGDLTGTYPDPSIAANAVTTAKISDEAVTGGKLANQIIKSGTLDDAAYSLILSNEGTGEDIGIGPLFSSYTRLQNSAGDLTLALVSQSVPEEGGIAGIVATKYLMMNSPGIQIETDELELRGTIYTKDLSPSLYVKTDASSKLTAEALSLDGVSLDEGKILIGDGSNQASAQSVSGNITMTSTGVTTIAADAVTTAKISDEAVTGGKLANQIIKSGTLDDAAYSLILSNEGTGEDIGIGPLFSSYTRLQNSAGDLTLALVSQSVPEEGGIAGIVATKYLMMNSPGIQIETDELELRGTIYTKDLSPSLYVKTDASSKLTAEAIDLSSGMSGTLGVLYGGTGISSYPPSGEILVGDGLDNYSLRLISGDVSMNYLGNVAINNGVVSTSHLTSNFVLPISKGGLGITSAPMGPQILVGYMNSYSLRTVSGDVSMDLAGNFYIGSGKITADKLASNFTLPVNRGGTGATIYPTGEIVFGNGINPLQSQSELSWNNTTNTVVVGQIPDLVGTTDTGLLIGTDDKITIGGITGGADVGNDAAIILGATRGGISSPAALQETDGLGGIIFAGYDGAEGQMGAYIGVEATQNWGIGANGTSLSLVATNDDDSGGTMLLLNNGTISALGNLGVLGSTAVATTLEVAGSVIYTPSGDHIISGSGIGADLLGSKVLLIKGDSALTTTNTIAAGQDGQMLVLIGQSESELIKFTGTGNLKLSANTDFTLGEGDIIQFIYVDSISKWVEISRTDN